MQAIVQEDGDLKTHSSRHPFLLADSKGWAAGAGGNWLKVANHVSGVLGQSNSEKCTVYRNGGFQESRTEGVRGGHHARLPEGGLASDTCCQVLAWRLPGVPSRTRYYCLPVCSSWGCLVLVLTFLRWFLKNAAAVLLL